MSINTYAQENNDNLKIIIVPKFKDQQILIDNWYLSKTSDSLQIFKLKFYLTDFKIQTKEGSLHSIPNSNYLIDAFDEVSLTIRLSNINYNKDDSLLFRIGVKESMNTSGALSGDLDPANGMFWSWQSGYINFKIEGISPSCKTRKNKFQFHIGGYQEPFTTTRSVTLDLKSIHNETLTISLDLSTFFTILNLNTFNQVMIPGKEASKLADSLPNLFSANE